MKEGIFVKNINETLDVINYGLKYYSNGTDHNGKPKRINLLEFFAVSAYNPSDLTKIVAIKNVKD